MAVKIQISLGYCVKFHRAPLSALMMDGWMVGWMDGWMDGWTDMTEWTDGWMDLFRAF